MSIVVRHKYYFHSLYLQTFLWYTSQQSKCILNCVHTCGLSQSRRNVHRHLPSLVCHRLYCCLASVYLANYSFFQDFCFQLWVWVNVSVFMWVQVSSEIRRRRQSPGAGVSGGSEHPCVGVESPMREQCLSTKPSLQPCAVLIRLIHH